jgi:hypothetical protein
VEKQPIVKFTFDLPVEQRQALRDLAAQHERSVGWMMRKLVTRFIEDTREQEKLINYRQG